MNVTIETSLGDITLELFEKEAPKTVANFLAYVDSGFYSNMIFHRVIDGFMIQGGGFTTDFEQKQAGEPIRNEADNRIGNAAGTIAMARTSDPHSATCQFFINVANNGFLDYSMPTPQGWGYCVFGKVINGMNIVEKIKKVATGHRGVHGDVPKENVVIKQVVRGPESFAE